MNRAEANVRRRDIQGLRALAVFAVICFHSNFVFRGGFLGVDIFFVISGWVITSNIWKTTRSGNFRLRVFLIARLRRLFPALAGMTIFVTALSFFLISPLGMQQNAAKSAIGAIAFCANWVIAKVTEGYFDLPASMNPFLHVWSLSLEEQFYLIFAPILSMVLFYAKRLSVKHFATFCVGVLTILSFAFMVRDSVNGFSGPFHWLSGFYSPFTRTWEFGIGSFSFLLFSNRNSIRSSKALDKLATLLFFGLVLSMILITPNYGFPSFMLLIPASFTSVLLVIGLRRNSPMGKFLRFPIVQYVGDRSYSLYLWHWPALMFANYLFPNSLTIKLLFLVVGLSMGTGSFRYLEQPIRSKKILSDKALLRFCALISFISVSLSMGVGYLAKSYYFPKYEAGKVPSRYPGDIGAIGFKSFSDLHTANCSDSTKGLIQTLKTCDADVAVLGDSHAQHLVPGLRKNFPSLGVIGVDLAAIRPATSRLGAKELVALENNHNISLVIISSYWYSNGVPENLRQTLTALVDSGKQILLLNDIPNFPFDAFTCKYGKSPFIKFGTCEMPRKNFTQELKTYDYKLSNASAGLGAVKLVSTSNYFCDPNRCSMVHNSELMYLDLNHLNTLGSIFVTRKIILDSRVFLCRNDKPLCSKI